MNNQEINENTEQITQYVDEFGNPIDPSLIDENGNYIGEQITQYVDEDGNPIDPSLIDENGNYIGTPTEEDTLAGVEEIEMLQPTIDQTSVASALNDAQNQTIETLDGDLVPEVTISASEHQMDDKQLMQGMVTFDYNNVPITDIVNSIILDAINKGASDIHFDPFDEGIKIRVRIDGQLNDYSIVPLYVKKNMITRIKIISGMNITESRTPQDGAIRTELANKTIDLRVSCLPTNMGEKIVIRIMDYSMSSQGIEALDFNESNLNKVKKMLSLPNGIILVTGATGTGKSTTVYSMLQRLNVEGTNLVTVEDPIEMNIAGINQVQAVSEIGLDFATVLRSILRQDPDVIMIGEIRDDETARIAVRASITGHLVLSTIHTNNSLNTIERLIDMNVERYLLGSSLSGIVSQKLARRLCDKCKKSRATTDYEKEVFKKALDLDIDEIFEPVGCPECQKGYRGRIAIQEVLLLNDHIRDAITKNVSKEELRKIVYTKGETQTMLEDGLEKVMYGKTSFDEILKLIDLEDDLGKDTQLGFNEQLDAAEMNKEESKVTNDSPVNINITPEFLEGLANISNKKEDIETLEEEIIVKPISTNKKQRIIEFNVDELKDQIIDEIASDIKLSIPEKEEIIELPEDIDNNYEKQNDIQEIVDIEEDDVIDDQTEPIIELDDNNTFDLPEETVNNFELNNIEEEYPLEEVSITPINIPTDTLNIDDYIDKLYSLNNEVNKKKYVLKVINILREIKSISNNAPKKLKKYINNLIESNKVEEDKLIKIINTYNELFNQSISIPEKEIEEPNEEVVVEETEEVINDESINNEEENEVINDKEFEVSNDDEINFDSNELDNINFDDLNINNLDIEEDNSLDELLSNIDLTGSLNDLDIDNLIDNDHEKTNKDDIKLDDDKNLLDDDTINYLIDDLEINE